MLESNDVATPMSIKPDLNDDFAFLRFASV